MGEVWHSLDAKEVLRRLNSGAAGLQNDEARKRLLEYGRNELAERRKINPLGIFVRQFRDFLILILIAAALISGFLLHEMTDAAVIMAIVVINAVLGFQQEYKAEKSLSALKKLVAPQAHVVRDGVEQKIPAAELVPGDILLISAGDRVPADALILEAVNLQVDEASLTGESFPSEKKAGMLASDASLGDRVNMVFMATTATYGRGKAVVVETGGRTEIGKIAEMVQSVEDEETPLQKNLERFGRHLGLGALAICGIVFIVGALTGKELTEMFLASVGLAVAAIPEGLPATVTIALAIGVQRMVKRHAIIRRLPAVETLGAATVICTDKTGTLTQNEMTARKILLPDLEVDVSGTGYKPEGDFTVGGVPLNVLENKAIAQILKIGILCNDASIRLENGEERVIGDPTELAFITLGEKAGLRQTIREDIPRMGEIPFDSDRKMMTTVHVIGGETFAFVKGAPDLVLEKSSRVFSGGKERAMTREDAEFLNDKSQEMASQALRLLGFAYRKLPGNIHEYKLESVERDLVFLGIVGLIDPPRPEAKEAISTCRRAGIKPIIITGDHQLTAEAIAREIGLIDSKGRAITGKELDSMGDDVLAQAVKDTSIFARVSPEHKMRIIGALLANGEVVAMGGDGVNDAPALKRADIGVAMGITGTDVAKESSDMILTDDNFASIVAAVDDGRGIYDNIRKFILFLLSSNSGEILTIFFGIMIGALAGWPLPVTAIQILWINLVTDGLPAVALSVDPKDPESMSKPPRPKHESIISKKMFWDILLIGVVMAAGTLYVLDSEVDVSISRAQTMAFTTLVFYQMFNVFNCRSQTSSALNGLFSNKYLIAAVILSLILQAAVIYAPPVLVEWLGGEHVSVMGFNIKVNTFGTVPLTVLDWIKVLAVSSTVFFAVEARKRLLP